MINVHDIFAKSEYKASSSVEAQRVGIDIPSSKLLAVHQRTDYQSTSTCDVDDAKLQELTNSHPGYPATVASPENQSARHLGPGLKFGVGQPTYSYEADVSDTSEGGNSPIMR